MPRNVKFIAAGAIVAFAFMVVVSGMDEIIRLLIVVALCACAVAVEKLL